jgi:hypothetical protein
MANAMSVERTRVTAPRKFTINTMNLRGASSVAAAIVAEELVGAAQSGDPASTPPQQIPSRQSERFLADFEASTLQADCAKGFFAAQAVLHLFFGSHLLIGPKLFIQLPLDLFLSEQ